MAFLVVLLVIVLLVRWIMIRSRLHDMEQALEDQSYRSQAQIGELTDRITVLENASRSHRSVPSKEAEPIAEPVREVVQPPPLPFVPPVAERLKPPPLAGPVPQAEPVFATVATPLEPEIPNESLGDRIRKQVGGREWEAVVGGNWLNKAGVLLLVKGVALLLGYEFSRVGPFGRVAIGLGVSLTLLIAGLLIERKPVYSVFARGLIGGGWAALYFTTYAMHGIPAAKVIDNPYAATLLLLAVALGMIFAFAPLSFSDSQRPRLFHRFRDAGAR